MPKSASQTKQQNNLLMTNKLEKLCFVSKAFFSWFAVCIVGLAFFSVIASYVYWWQQAVRGPSIIYFNIALVVTLYFGRKALLLLVFCLPLMPTLHLQLELLLHPPVKYFIAYPGMDVIVGLCTGLYLRHIYKTRTWLVKQLHIPWVFGLLLFVLSLSTMLAVARNLWQSATSFSFVDLAYNVLRFKVMDKANDFAPIADLLVYSIAALLALVVLDVIRNEKNKDAYLFKPIILGVIVSACWGIFQSQTSFGLSELTREYRPENFGFGAEGFQPDIHAFAGHMLIGAVGLLGYVVYVASRSMRYLATFASLLSWVAIVLSKSRASLVFAVLLTIIFGLIVLKNKRTKTSKSLFAPILLLALVTGGAFIASYYLWLGEFFAALKNSDISNFETINLLSRWRLEFFRAALLMFDAYPWMGLGQGNFYRLSTIYELTQSTWLANSVGNNAHNYFLQTLAETGMIGVGCFVLIFVWPFYHVADKTKLVPVAMLILSVFLGNLYSHSLLIRENLFLLAVFVGLMYALIDRTLIHQDQHSCQLLTRCQKVSGYLVMFLLSAAIYFAVAEIAASFYKVPFQHAGHCYQGAKQPKNCDAR